MVFAARLALRLGISVSAVSAETFKAAWPLAAGWTEFLCGEFAVAILVEFLQGLGGLGDLLGVNDAILVQVERLDEGIHRRLTTH